MKKLVFSAQDFVFEDGYGNAPFLLAKCFQEKAQEIVDRWWSTNVEEVMKLITENEELEAELISLKADIENAPIVYGKQNTHWIDANLDAPFKDECTHSAKLINIEEINR